MVCVSNAVRKECIDAGYRVPLQVIVNGIIDKEKLTSKIERTRIGFLGMYAPRKGFQIIKKWVYELQRENIEWLFYGDIYKGLKSEALQLQQHFPDKVFLRGNQDPTTIFNEISMLVHASTMFDPLPTTLLEAAMNGIPAIASSIGGAGEIIVHNQTGFIYDYNTPHQGLEFLKALVYNKELQRSMELNARRRFEKHFTIDNMIGNYKLFWNSLVNS